MSSFSKILKLRNTEKVQRTPRGAFIRGETLEDWLKVMNQWQISVDQLTCYVLPSSLNDLNASGLFVLFPEGMEILDIINTYGKLGDKLYLPIHAELTPQINLDELQQMLLWEVQVFHPSIGLVGFAKSDQLNIGDYLLTREEITKNWGLAQPGISPPHPLRKIHVKLPPAKDLINDLKNTIDKKSLKDIPKEEGEEDKPSDLDEKLDNFKRRFIRGAMDVTENTGNSINRIFGLDPYQGERGYLNDLYDWLGDKLDDLNKKRQDEIDRLMDLFEKDPKEALKYALPLDSPYLHRGIGRPSDRLGRNNTNFDLGRLGGGEAVDGWNIGDRYHDLRQQYLKTAKQLMEKGAYRQAAYVYAHLLGNYEMAAHALKKGKFFHEAAAIYLEHLKRREAAAECFEEGGLFHEAIELYIELKKYEKVGDLYTQIDQQEVAKEYYLKSMNKALENGDHLEAARISIHKLGWNDRAKEILLEGWKGNQRYEACLKQYFGLIAKGDDASLGLELEIIFNHHTPDFKKESLLNIAAFLHKNHHSSELANFTQRIAYQIISEYAQKGNVKHLHKLKQFIERDQLILSDVSRFKKSRLHLKPKSKPSDEQTIKFSTSFQLDEGITWLKGLSHQGQYLILGIKNGHLHLARANWKGYTEMYVWNQEITGRNSFNLMSPPPYSSSIMLYVSSMTAFGEKELPMNLYFSHSLKVSFPIWLPDNLVGYCLNKEQEISELSCQYGATLLQSWNHKNIQEPALGNSAHCKIVDTGEAFDLGMDEEATEMIFRKKTYFLIRNQMLISVKPDGKTMFYELGSPAYMICATNPYATFRLAVATKDGCLLLDSSLDKDASRFAKDMYVVAMSFVSANILVLASRNEARIYQVLKNDVILSETINLEETIISIMPAKRGEFAVLSRGGKVRVYEYNI